MVATGGRLSGIKSYADARWSGHHDTSTDDELHVVADIFCESVETNVDCVVTTTG